MKRLFVVFWLLISSAVLAQERIYFDSRDHTHSSEEIFRGQATRPQQLWGDLYLPREKKDRYPAVILAHASDGIVQWRENDLWKPFWLEQGYAVFIVDTFKPRNTGHTYENQGTVKWHIHNLDYLFALEALAKDSRIDAGQIGLMGFSRGGMAALGVSNAAFSWRYNIRNKYQWTIGFYPGCQHHPRFTQANNPILLVIGSNDDYTPEWMCREFTKQIESVGGQVEFVSIKGAYHNFDAPYSANWKNYLEIYNKCYSWSYDMPRNVWTNLDGSPLPSSISLLSLECHTAGRGKNYGATIGSTGRSLSKAKESVNDFMSRVKSNSVASTYIVK